MPGEFFTRRELVMRSLAELKVTEAGQAPNAEDFTTMDSLVEAVTRSLEQRRVAYIQDIENIEAHFFLPLAICLAGAGAQEFGGQVDVAKAENDLRVMSQSGPSYAVMKMVAY